MKRRRLKISRRLLPYYKPGSDIAPRGVDDLCNEDIFIPLQVRVAKAQKQRADLFVSIHADAFMELSYLGWMVSKSLKASSGLSVRMADSYFERILSTV